MWLPAKPLEVGRRRARPPPRTPAALGALRRADRPTRLQDSPAAPMSLRVQGNWDIVLEAFLLNSITSEKHTSPVYPRAVFLSRQPLLLSPRPPLLRGSGSGGGGARPSFTPAVLCSLFASRLNISSTWLLCSASALRFPSSVLSAAQPQFSWYKKSSQNIESHAESSCYFC